MYHDPVLREEAIQLLLTPSGRMFVDGTVGGGGHAEEICRRMDRSAKLVCFDVDEDAIRFAQKRLGLFKDRVVFVHSNISSIEPELLSRGIRAIDGLLLDLGVSSFQLDDAAKGFSFRADERIDMRMDRRQKLSGWDVVNQYAEEELAELLWEYGEERNSERIANRIVARRPIQTTAALRDAVRLAAGERFLMKTLARVFQAIRIEVNDELRNLERALRSTVEILSPGGRMVVISYHSLEDRIVKDFIRRNAATSVASGNKYVPDTVVAPTLKMLTKKPIVVSPSEVERNPRARSAKLRAAERIGRV